MHRAAPVLLLLTSLLAGCAAPRPADLLPLRAGTEWTYLVEGAGPARRHVHRVDPAGLEWQEMADGGACTRVFTEERTGAERGLEAWAVRDGALLAYPTAPGCGGPHPDRRAPPVVVLPVGQLEAGRRWPAAAGVEGELLALDEEVAVPAGRLACVHVRLRGPAGDEHLWLAPGVGIVRRSLPGGRTLALVEHRPGPDRWTDLPRGSEVVRRHRWAAHGRPALTVTVYRSRTFGWTDTWLQIDDGLVTISGPVVQGPGVPSYRFDGATLAWDGVTLGLGAGPDEFLVNGAPHRVDRPTGSYHVSYRVVPGGLELLSVGM